MLNMYPYLNFMGTAEAAMNFYKAIFGGEFSTFQRFKDIPGNDKLSPEDQNKIMHISLPVGTDMLLMATDAIESMGHKLIAGNNFHLCLNAESKEEADNLFNGLSAGGHVEMPMEQTFWGAYFGMVQDKFHIRWMVNFEKK